MGHGPLRPQKITFGEMRASGVRGLLVYCADFRCSHWTAIVRAGLDGADRSLATLLALLGRDGCPPNEGETIIILMNS